VSLIQTHSDEHWMSLALAQAREAAAAGEVPVGAVVVKDGHLIASGRNAPIAGHDPTAHAEVMALREAARVLGNYRLDGCNLYVTLEPCAMCSGAMLHARLARVVFGAPDPRTGTAGSVLNLFEQSQLNHQTQVLGGVLADDCAQLLKDFFKPRRVNTSPLREDALRTPLSAFEGLPSWPAATQFLCEGPHLQGLRLAYVDLGAVSATAATVWLHGPDSWSLSWQDVVLQTVRTHPGTRHVVPDLIGFGQSDKPKKEHFHTAQTHAGILDALFDQLKLSSVQLVAPSSMRPLLQTLQNLQPGRYQLAPAQNPSEQSRAHLLAPYPDKGFMAGPRALCAWTAEA
jgi:tRNA(adenine34) deaminase